MDPCLAGEELRLEQARRPEVEVASLFTSIRVKIWLSRLPCISYDSYCIRNPHNPEIA